MFKVCSSVEGSEILSSYKIEWYVGKTYLYIFGLVIAI